MQREAKIQTGLDHPNVIALYAAFEDMENVYLVQELASGGDLFRRRNKGNKHAPQRDEHNTINQVIVPILKALQYMHNKVIIAVHAYQGKVIRLMQKQTLYDVHAS